MGRCYRIVKQRPAPGFKYIYFLASFRPSFASAPIKLGSGTVNTNTGLSVVRPGLSAFGRGHQQAGNFSQAGHQGGQRDVYLSTFCGGGAWQAVAVEAFVAPALSNCPAYPTVNSKISIRITSITKQE